MSGLFRFFDEEPPTLKREALADIPCPRCKRSTYESIEKVEELMFRVTKCHSCEGKGMVSPEKAVAIKAELAAEQMAKDPRREPE